MKNEYDDKVLFFNYLESNGLNSLYKPYILEYAPNILESQSKLIVEKYVEQIKQYLVSRCFDEHNPYRVKGTRGVLYLKNHDIKINTAESIFEEHLYKTKKLFELKKEEPKTSDFNVLLIQGMPNVVLNLYGTKMNKIFGDVIDEDDNNYKRLYEAIYKLVCESSYHEYELCHDKISELKKELYLIKRR